MTDYYLLLAVAIAGLMDATPDRRRDVYDRARSAMIERLRSMTPPVDEDEIAAESAAFDAAVARLENELSPTPVPIEAPAKPARARSLRRGRTEPPAASPVQRPAPSAELLSALLRPQPTRAAAPAAAPIMSSEAGTPAESASLPAAEPVSPPAAEPIPAAIVAAEPEPAPAPVAPPPAASPATAASPPVGSAPNESAASVEIPAESAPAEIPAVAEPPLPAAAAKAEAAPPAAEVRASAPRPAAPPVVRPAGDAIFVRAAEVDPPKAKAREAEHTAKPSAEMPAQARREPEAAAPAKPANPFELITFKKPAAKPLAPARPPEKQPAMEKKPAAEKEVAKVDAIAPLSATEEKIVALAERRAAPPQPKTSVPAVPKFRNPLELIGIGRKARPLAANEDEDAEVPLARTAEAPARQRAELSRSVDLAPKRMLRDEPYETPPAPKPRPAVRRSTPKAEPGFALPAWKTATGRRMSLTSRTAPRPAPPVRAPTVLPPATERSSIWPKADQALVAAGVAMAFLSGAFGIFMNLPQNEGLRQATERSMALNFNSDVDTAPQNTAEIADAGDSPPAGDTSSSADVDPVATASITTAPQRRIRRVDEPPMDPASGTEPRLKGYHLRNVFQGMALIEGPRGLALVKPGAQLDGAGLVTAIEKRDSKWVIATSEGIISDDQP